MSDLEEVDVEQQLKKAEESGDDTGSIILTDKSDIDSDDDEDDNEDTTLSGDDEKDPEEDDMGQDSDIEDDDNTYNVGDFVKLGYQPEFEVQQVYKIKEIILDFFKTAAGISTKIIKYLRNKLLLLKNENIKLIIFKNTVK